MLHPYSCTTGYFSSEENSSRPSDSIAKAMQFIKSSMSPNHPVIQWKHQRLQTVMRLQLHCQITKYHSFITEYGAMIASYDSTTIQTSRKIGAEPSETVSTSTRNGIGQPIYGRMTAFAPSWCDNIQSSYPCMIHTCTIFKEWMPLVISFCIITEEFTPISILDVLGIDITMIWFNRWIHRRQKEHCFLWPIQWVSRMMSCLHRRIIRSWVNWLIIYRRKIGGLVYLIWLFYTARDPCFCLCRIQSFRQMSGVRFWLCLQKYIPNRERGISTICKDQRGGLSMPSSGSGCWETGVLLPAWLASLCLHDAL